MEVRYLPNRETYMHMTTEGLRKSFVMENLFPSGTVSMIYFDADRAIAGGIIPVGSAVPLMATKKEMAAEYFAERRELGIVNLGSHGTVRVDGKEYRLDFKDMLYIGRGAKTIEFASMRASEPAVFYFVSYPAHAEYPVSLVKYGDAVRTPLGTVKDANKRTIYKYIHAQGAQSCQLVMGLTDVDPGSVWNSMPPHTHQRRSEIYLYCGLGADAFVVHLMGTPGETRNLILRNLQAVISPAWSIHCGAGTTNYTFVWAMGGENQEFQDMDVVPMQDIR